MATTLKPLDPVSDAELEKYRLEVVNVVIPEPQKTPDPPNTDGQSVYPVQVTPQRDTVQSEVNNTPLLTPAQSIARAQTQPPATDPQAAAADFNNATNAGVLAAINKNPTSTSGSLAGSVDQARTGAVTQTQKNTRQKEDWRVRLQLAGKANYLYKSPKITQSDLLYPLVGTDGVIFPYTPQIQMSYRANYDSVDLVHNNYRQHFYRNSSVDDISINAEFTAQDTSEANYLLAVIHFFRSVTKMFYGQDTDPKAGTPPPLCYLSGLGQFQFSDHPVLISSFSYSLPNDIDYIRAGSTTQYAGVNLGPYESKQTSSTLGSYIPGLDRLRGSKLKKGAITSQPTFNRLSNSNATYVPTKIQIQLTAIPIVTRFDTATKFSLEKYATGELLSGGFW